MRHWFLLYSLLALLISQASAENPSSLPSLPPEEFNLELLLVDASTAKPMTGKVASLELVGGGQRISTIQLLGDDGVARLLVPAGRFQLSAEINDPGTAGADYVAVANLSVEGDSRQSTYLNPVGSASGFVYDGENRSVQGATINLACVGDADYLPRPEDADDSGVYVVKYVPASTACKVVASKADRVGFAEVTVERGEYWMGDIHLSGSRGSRNAEGSNGEMPLFIALALFLGGTAIAGLFFARKWRAKVSPQPRHAEPENKPLEASKRMSDVVGTLNDNERRIVEFIIEKGGSTTQARVHHALLIPKVSLSRAIYSLETKNILKTSKLGKMKKLEFTDWFKN